MLTAIVTLMAVIASGNLFSLTPAPSHPMGEGAPATPPAGMRNEPLYYGLLLFLQSGLFGTFTALNFFHWFIFWEFSLIPAFFLVRLWGGSQRAPAATQFFIYTMVGSVAMLLAFLAIFIATGKFDFIELAGSTTLAADLSTKIGWLSGDKLAWLVFAGVL